MSTLWSPLLENGPMEGAHPARLVDRITQRRLEPAVPSERLPLVLRFRVDENTFAEFARELRED